MERLPFWGWTWFAADWQARRINFSLLYLTKMTADSPIRDAALCLNIPHIPEGMETRRSRQDELVAGGDLSWRAELAGGQGEDKLRVTEDEAPGLGRPYIYRMAEEAVVGETDVILGAAWRVQRQSDLAELCQGRPKGGGQAVLPLWGWVRSTPTLWKVLVSLTTAFRRIFGTKGGPQFEDPL